MFLFWQTASHRNALFAPLFLPPPPSFLTSLSPRERNAHHSPKQAIALMRSDGQRSTHSLSCLSFSPSLPLLSLLFPPSFLVCFTHTHRENRNSTSSQKVKTLCGPLRKNTERKSGLVKWHANPCMFNCDYLLILKAKSSVEYFCSLIESRNRRRILSPALPLFVIGTCKLAFSQLPSFHFYLHRIMKINSKELPASPRLLHAEHTISRHPKHEIALIASAVDFAFWTLASNCVGKIGTFGVWESFSGAARFNISHLNVGTALFELGLWHECSRQRR